LGSHLVIGQPIRFSHRHDEWQARVTSRRAVRYDISFDPVRGRWYVAASWKASPQPAPDLAELRQRRVLGVDLNDGHLGCCVLDASGNPIGAPLSIEVATAGLRASPIVTGGYARPSPRCLISPARTTARRWWWRTWTSRTPAPPAGTRSAVASGGNGCVAPSLVSPPACFGIG
jgi:hypothetical protein